MKLLDSIAANTFTSWESDDETTLTVVSSKDTVLLNITSPYMGSACCELTDQEVSDLAAHLRAAGGWSAVPVSLPDNESGVTLKITQAIAGEPYREGVCLSICGEGVEVQIEMETRTAEMLSLAVTAGGVQHPGLPMYA